MSNTIFKKSLQKHRKGFSLIEILCILGVMLVLFVAFFRIYTHRNNEIKFQIAREELSLLNCALEYYHTSCGTYPPGNQQSIEQNSISLSNSLLKEPKGLLAGHNWKLINDKITDPWGRPYIYKFSGQQGDSYILFSMGPNGHIDEHELIDDIYSR